MQGRLRESENRVNVLSRENEELMGHLQKERHNAQESEGKMTMLRIEIARLLNELEEKGRQINDLKSFTRDSTLSQSGVTSTSFSLD